MKQISGRISLAIVAGGILFFATTKSSQEGAASTSIPPVVWRDSSAPGALLSDAPDSEDGVLSLDEVLAEIRVKTQSFEINPTENAEIEGDKGTRIVFPAGTFFRSDGRPLSQRVRIELTECYSLGDILSEELSTTSGSTIIETAGMIRVRAFDGSTELEVTGGSVYYVMFPKKDQDDFELFYGERTEDGVMDWTLSPDARVTPGEDGLPEFTSTEEVYDDRGFSQQMVLDGVFVSDAETSDDNADASSGFIEITASYLRGFTGKIQHMDYYKWRLLGGENLNSYFVGNFNPPLEMIAEYARNQRTTEVTFRLNEKGQIRELYLSKTSRTEYDQQIIDFMEQLPPLDINRLMPRYVDDHACILRFGIGSGDSRDGYLAGYRKDNGWKENKTLATASREDLDYYVFNAAELGWINCDRFVETENPVDFVVQTENADSCYMSLVFDDMNSVLKGIPQGNNSVLFSGVPAGKSGRLISVRCVNGTPGLATLNTRTSAKPVRLDAYRAFTLKELDQQLQTLN